MIGWCGSLQSCIKGTALGPAEPCSSSYVFAWLKIINIRYYD